MNTWRGSLVIALPPAGAAANMLQMCIRNLGAPQAAAFLPGERKASFAARMGSLQCVRSDLLQCG